MQLAQNRSKPRVRVQRREQERTLETEHGPGALRDGTLQPVDRPIVLAEPGVNVGEMVRRYVRALRPRLEIAQGRVRFRVIPSPRVRRPELA